MSGLAAIEVLGALILVLVFGWFCSPHARAEPASIDRGVCKRPRGAGRGVCGNGGNRKDFFPPKISSLSAARALRKYNAFF